MSLNDWITLVAFLSGLWGVAVTFWSPTRLRTKLLCLIPFVVLAIIGVVLVHKQSKQQEQAERDAQVSQQHLQESLDQTQQKVTVLQGQVSAIEAKTLQPGAPDEKLDSIVKILGEATKSTNAINSNNQLRIEVADLVHRLRDFGHRMDALQPKIDEVKRRELLGRSRAEQEKIIAQLMEQESQARSQWGAQYQQEYERDYKARVNVLHAEMLRRIPAEKVGRRHTGIYEMVGRASDASDVATDLEELALLLPK